jgi:hypothetical protein
MTTITEFNRTTCKALGEEIEQALAGIASKYGVSISCKGGTFGPTSYVAKVECAVIAGGLAVTREVEAFNKMASLYGLAPSDLGRSFAYSGGTYSICGLKPSSRNPVLAKRQDGKVFKFPVEVVKYRLATAA